MKELVENIPFDINIKNGASLVSINNLFGNWRCT